MRTEFEDEDTEQKIINEGQLHVVDPTSFGLCDNRIQNMEEEQPISL